MALTKIPTHMLFSGAASEDLSIDADTLYIDSSTNRVGIANNSPSVALDVTGAAKISSTLDLTSHLDMPDSAIIKLGTGDDLQIYHDGSNSFISEAGTGGLKILSGDVYIRNPSDADMIHATSGGAVTLYHNANAKLATTSSGIQVSSTYSGSADAVLAKFQRDGGAVAAAVTYADATTDMEFGTTTSHGLSLTTADTRRLTIASGGAVTIAGTLGVTGVVTANAGVVVDDITIDGSTISTSSSLTLDLGGNLTINVDGTVVSLSDDTVNFGQFFNSGAGTFNIYSPTSNQDMVFRGNDGGSGIIALTLDMSDAGTAKFNNKVQIGSPTTDGTLAVKATGAYIDLDGATNNNSGMRLYENGTFKWQLYNDGDAGDPFKIDTSSATAMVVTQSGDVLIGSGGSGPLTKAQIHTLGATISSGNAIKSSTMKGLTISNSGNGAESVGVWFGTNEAHWSGISGQRNDTGTWDTDLRFYTHEAATNDLTYSRERMRITGAGNVGIGNTDPSSALEVGDGSSTYVKIRNASSGDVSSGYNIMSGATTTTSLYGNAGEGWTTLMSGGSIGFRVNNASSGFNPMNIDTSGDVRIGSSSSAYGFAERLIVGDADTNEGITIQSGTTHQGNLAFNDGGTTAKGRVSYQHGSNYMQFFVNNTEEVRIQNGGGISFNGDTATANALDDYEEGYHDPTVLDEGGGATYTLNNSYSRLAYTKVGRLVTVTGTIVISGVSGTATGTASLSLPFTCADLSEQSGKSGGAGVGYYQVQNYTSGTYPQQQIPEGQAKIYLYYGQVDANQYETYFNSSTQLYFQVSYFAA